MSTLLPPGSQGTSRSWIHSCSCPNRDLLPPPQSTVLVGATQVFLHLPHILPGDQELSTAVGGSCCVHALWEREMSQSPKGFVYWLAFVLAP
jgi:hypothetical protein